MSIRLLARDLYRLQKEVELLEQKLARAPLGQRREIEAALRKTRAEKESLRRALDGQIGR
jgi:hypothetical protein